MLFRQPRGDTLLQSDFDRLEGVEWGGIMPTGCLEYLLSGSTVDQLTARRGDAAMFTDFQQRFERSTVPLLRSRWLGTLGSFEDPALEVRALEYMVSDKVPPTEGFSIMRGFAGKTEAASHRLADWMMANYDKIASRVPPPMLRFMPMMGSGCSEERLKATQAFYADPARAVPGVDKTLERVADQVHGCLSLREREGKAVSEFLHSLGAK